MKLILVTSILTNPNSKNSYHIVEDHKDYFY